MDIEPNNTIKLDTSRQLSKSIVAPPKDVSRKRSRAEIEAEASNQGAKGG